MEHECSYVQWGRKSRDMCIYALALSLLVFWQHRYVVSNQNRSNSNDNPSMSRQKFQFWSKYQVFQIHNFEILGFLRISFEIPSILKNLAFCFGFEKFIAELNRIHDAYFHDYLIDGARVIEKLQLHLEWTLSHAFFLGLTKSTYVRFFRDQKITYVIGFKFHQFKFSSVLIFFCNMSKYLSLHCGKSGNFAFIVSFKTRKRIFILGTNAKV